jgi:hypothetical protein
VIALARVIPLKRQTIAVRTIRPDSTHRGVPGLLAPESILDDEDPPSHAERRARRVLSDEAQARRRHLGRYVGVVVGIALAICLAALARNLMSDRSLPAPRTAAAATAGTPSPFQLATAAAGAPSATPSPSAAPSPATAASASTTIGSTSADSIVPDPAAALTAKRQSQRALESGKLADAVEAGERAVALDPSDAESWLILGAAYQSRGATADARRCFSSCVRLGKRGPRGECAAMLR